MNLTRLAVPPLIAIATLFSLRPALPAATPLINIVDEKTAFVLVVRDVPALLKTWNDSPWTKAWDDKEIKKFLAPLRAKMKTDEWDEKTKAETGFTPDEICALIQGDLLLVIGDFAALDTLDDFPEKTGILLAAEIGTNADAVKKLMASLEKQKDATVATETYDNVAITIVTSPSKEGKMGDDAWAIAGGKLLFAPSKKIIIDAIDALKNGGAENAFGKSTRYLRMAGRIGDAQVLYTINFQNLYPIINTAISKNAASQTPVAKVVDFTTLASTLGLDAIEDIHIGITLGSENTGLTGALTFTERRGLFKLLALDEGTAELPAFASADWLATATSRYSIPGVYSASEELLSNIAPVVAMMLQSSIQQYNERLGIDIKRDLIGSIGDRITTANILPAGASHDDPHLLAKLGALYALELKDVRTFTNTLDTIKRALGLDNNPMFAQRDYLGAQINTFDSRNPGSQPFSFAIAKNQFLLALGDPTIIEAVVRNITNGAPSAMKDRPDVRQAFVDAPANISSFGIQNIGLTIRILCAGLAMLPQTQEIFDPTAIPDPDVFEKYWGNSYSWMTDESGSINFTAKVTHSK